MRDMLTHDEISTFFQTTRVDIEGNANLRIPQIEGHAEALEFFRGGGQAAIEQIPVGCGKSGLITLLPFGIARGRVLVIAPNLQIRDQLADDFDFRGVACFYRKTASIADLHKGPFLAKLDTDANVSDCEGAHVVVTNIQQLERADRWLSNFSDDFFDLIIVDEGHHNAAPSWKRVFKKFPRARVISLTATPFRADDQPIDGTLIYRYPFSEAMKQGFIKTITAVNVAPHKLTFTYRGDSHAHTLEEVLQLREKDWFSKGIALARECNVSIADASLQWLDYLRSGKTPHQLIAVACSLDHAREVRGIYQERGYEAREIHSGQSKEEREQVLRDLRNGVLDVIVQVQMLGEGFDHPTLSVAAVFRPFRSLSPYIQFVGRVMRVIHQKAPHHADNEGVVVSHVGLNIDRHWDDFKLIDERDRNLVHGWLNAPDGLPPREEGERRRLRPDMLVTEELVDRFIADSFIDPTDDTAIDNILNALSEQGFDPEALGLDRDDLRRRFIAVREAGGRPGEPIRLPVQPQARRKVLRQRLVEQTKSAAARICEALGENVAGKRLAALGGTGAVNNLGHVIKLMSAEVNHDLGIGKDERRDVSIEKLERTISNLDDLADKIEAQLKEQLA